MSTQKHMVDPQNHLSRYKFRYLFVTLADINCPHVLFLRVSCNYPNFGLGRETRKMVIMKLVNSSWNGGHGNMRWAFEPTDTVEQIAEGIVLILLEAADDENRTVSIELPDWSACDTPEMLAYMQELTVAIEAAGGEVVQKTIDDEPVYCIQLKG